MTRLAVSWDFTLLLSDMYYTSRHNNYLTIWKTYEDLN